MLIRRASSTSCPSPIFVRALLDQGEATFDENAFSRLVAIEGSCFWFQNRRDLIAWALRRHLRGTSSFLEVGCGTGFVLQGLRRAFPELHLVGGDYYASGLAFARRRLPGVELHQLDARELPSRTISTRSARST